MRALSTVLISLTAIVADAQSVAFVQRPAVVGTHVEQASRVELKLTTSHRHRAEVLSEETATMHRSRRWHVVIEEVRDGRAIAARVTYEGRHHCRREKWLESGVVPAAYEDTPSPVAGKTYHVRRDGEQLSITNEVGDIPPADEYEIVAQTMETLGQPNPLVEYLAGRTVEVGERLEMPNEMASEFLGLVEQGGNVRRFWLTLDRLTEHEGETFAVFKTELHTAGDAGQMGLLVEGDLAIQPEGCRVAKLELSGPVGSSRSLGTTQVITTGNVRVESASWIRR